MVQREFAHKVKILTPTGKFLYQTHGEHAKALVRDGMAEFCGPAKKVRCLQLTMRHADTEPIPCRPGRKYVTTETVRDDTRGRAFQVWKYKRLHPSVLPIFLSAPLGCLSEEKPTPIG